MKRIIIKMSTEKITGGNIKNGVRTDGGYSEGLQIQVVIPGPGPEPPDSTYEKRKSVNNYS